VSSLARKLKRRHGLATAARERPYRVTERGYETLHPTKGWQKISFDRLKRYQTIVPPEPQPITDPTVKEETIIKPGNADQFYGNTAVDVTP
jgi:hypothetical protein